MKEQYILREKDEVEINRLAFQHEVWREMTAYAIDKAEVCPGEHILDMGCGPGYLSIDLAEKVGLEGQITAIDNSEKFIRYLQNQQIPNVKARQLDILQELNQLSGKGIDKVFCRWVLMFLPDVDKALKEVFQLLKPGGKFISIEYFRFQEMAVWPESAIFKKLYSKVHQLIGQGGGNPDIGGSMAKMLETAGFENTTVFPVYRTGKVGSPLWEWVNKTNPNHENLVHAGLLSAEDFARYKADWAEKSKDKNAFVLAPPLMITIGEKRK